MKTAENYVSDETLKALRNAGIIDSDELVTITDCAVWFAENGIAIITDYNGLDHEWTAMACGRVPVEDIECRNSQSYTDAMNAAIIDAAEIYKTKCSECEYSSDNGICKLYNVDEPLDGECYNW